MQNLTLSAHWGCACKDFYVLTTIFSLTAGASVFLLISGKERLDSSVEGGLFVWSEHGEAFPFGKAPCLCAGHRVGAELAGPSTPREGGGYYRGIWPGLKGGLWAVYPSKFIEATAPPS